MKRIGSFFVALVLGAVLVVALPLFVLADTPEELTFWITGGGVARGDIDMNGFDLHNASIVETTYLHATTDNATSMTLSAGFVGAEYSNSGAGGLQQDCAVLSASPADGDLICTRSSQGKDSAGNWEDYGDIITEIQDPTNGSEESIVRFKVRDGAGASTEYMRLDGTDNLTAVVLNRSLRVGPNAMPTDAAPVPATVIATKPVFTHAVPAGAGSAGAALVLAPSPGARTLTGVTKAGTAGDTITFGIQMNGVVTTPFITEGVGTWNCAGAATDIECVCNLYTYLTVTAPITGVTVTRTNGTCSDEKLGFGIVPGVSSGLTVTPSDNTNETIVNGADGQVFFPAGAVAAPSITSPIAPTTGIIFAGGTPQLTLVANATTAFAIRSTAIFGYVPFQSVGTGTAAAPRFSFSGDADTGVYGYAADRLGVATGGSGGAVEELMYGEVTAIDMSSVARQTLYTVPATRTFYPRRVCVGPCSAVIDTAVGAFGSDTPAADFHAAANQFHTAAASEACFWPADGIAVPSIAAAGTFAYDGTVAEGAADTCTMRVYGVLR